MDCQEKEYGGLKGSSVYNSAEVFRPLPNVNVDAEAMQRVALIEWLNDILPSISLPPNASDEDMRKLLLDGAVFCCILNKLKPGSIAESQTQNVSRFLTAMDTMGLPRFQISDLEKGSMKIVIQCLLTLRAQFTPNVNSANTPPSYSKSGIDAIMRWKSLGQRLSCGNGGFPREESPQPFSSSLFGEEKRKGPSDSKRTLQSNVMTEPSTALMRHVGHKFHEVFQLTYGGYADLPAAKITEMMKSNSLDNAPTQSLLSVVNGILDESVERKNGEIPHRVACLMRKVVQEIERRISTQADHLRTQNNLFKSREEKYQSRIRVLEALATGTNEESQMVMNQLQQIKMERTKMEERKKVEEQGLSRLMQEKDQNNQEIKTLKQELETTRKAYRELCQQMEMGAKGAQRELEDQLEEVEKGAKGAQQEFELTLKKLENLLAESRNRVKELEEDSESKSKSWSKKEHIYEICTEFQLGSLQELSYTAQLIKQEILKTQKSYSDEFNCLGTQIKNIQDAAASYYEVLAQNRMLTNQLQDLKGNIRVYCRIRPFLQGQKGGVKSTIEHIGENGELIVVNPSRQGKESRRSFKFNKVYGPAATQAEVFTDTQPLVQSILDGYNVCIFAYGQTGSGKTYTMTGPDGATEEEHGVNYRALNDLFHISRSRESAYTYEISVQMVEIYNEQVHDLLTSNGSRKKLGISTTTQSNGLAVPDASMHPVQSTSDVMELMDIGLRNRAKGATALNERSSRSHSVVSIHVCGMDMRSSSSLRGNLHLVDLAGSERVDRSEVTGDRLKEAQHINKSLSALGDVIFSLAQKSSHVPYRNSKLTQVLQSSLGGQAKTLMFVQLNPDVSSYSESISTLKFAERVSGVELGAARTSKDSRDVRELMEQVASLRDTISKKDEEIDRLQLLKDLKKVNPWSSSENHASTSESPSPRNETPRSLNLFDGKSSRDVEDAGPDQDLLSSDKQSVASSQKSTKSLQQSNFSEQHVGHNHPINAESAGIGDAEYEQRLSDMSAGTDTSDDSNYLSEGSKQAAGTDRPRSMNKIPRPLLKSPMVPSRVSSSTALRKSPSGSSLKPSRRWQ